MRLYRQSICILVCWLVVVLAFLHQRFSEFDCPRIDPISMFSCPQLLTCLLVNTTLNLPLRSSINVYKLQIFSKYQVSTIDLSFMFILLSTIAVCMAL